jgi:hypothetical protein
MYDKTAEQTKDGGYTEVYEEILSESADVCTFPSLKSGLTWYRMMNLKGRARPAKNSRPR